ncbi:hypothetical protein B0H13DRAFT_2272203 [Mycena leptocephala]|nr:hypothetical protein B0H13DRAFT_2272203 [Mycena leptocephala]
MFSVPGTRFSIPCCRRFYTAACTDVAPWEMTLALARFPFRYHPRTHPVSIFLSIYTRHPSRETCKLNEFPTARPWILQWFENAKCVWLHDICPSAHSFEFQKFSSSFPTHIASRPASYKGLLSCNTPSGDARNSTSIHEQDHFHTLIRTQRQIRRLDPYAQPFETSFHSISVGLRTQAFFIVPLTGLVICLPFVFSPQLNSAPTGANCTQSVFSREFLREGWLPVGFTSNKPSILFKSRQLSKLPPELSILNRSNLKFNERSLCGSIISALPQPSTQDIIQPIPRLDDGLSHCRSSSLEFFYEVNPAANYAKNYWDEFKEEYPEYAKAVLPADSHE